ncbi:MAG: hypothetical protein H6738_22795 [Alphaproteobacteria bacterium]|nr:hypothetical protein [Alphaproteobacteria bacterium]MCB9699631.1 hypothetical protein [Alphaproteobacteria bacterium]
MSWCFARVAIVTSLLAACAGEPPIVPTDDGPTNDGDADDDGYSLADGDCDDSDPDIHPDANDIFGDGIDQNCDQADGVDADGDGHAWTGSGGDDCDDSAPTIYANAPEVGWDDIDQDCDGRDRFDFVALGGGEDHTCGVDSTGRVRCWGADDEGQVSDAPADTGWKDVCGGRSYACAVADDGRVRCWGRDDLGQVSGAPSDANYGDVACGFQSVCALTADDREPVCWGDDTEGVVSGAPPLQFADIDLGLRHGCGITRNERVVVCWGTGALPGQDVGDHIPFGGGYVSITSGQDFSCAIRQDLGLTCFGATQFGQSSPPSDAGPYAGVSARKSFACGVLDGDRLSCWGLDNQYQVGNAPKNVDVSYVGIGYDHGCALEAKTHEPLCWGKDFDGQASPPWP